MRVAKTILYSALITLLSLLNTNSVSSNNINPELGLGKLTEIKSKKKINVSIDGEKGRKRNLD